MRRLITKQPAQISVGMPVYNGEAFLEAAIESVLQQSFGDFRLYISDNASTDRTAEICQDFALQDSRIEYSRNPVNIGAAANYNRVFKMASGPYFRWFCADDLAALDLHEKCLEVLEANPDVVLCCGHTQMIDGEGRVTESYRETLDLRQEKVEERYLTFWRTVGLTNAIYGLMRTSAVGATALMGKGSFPATDTVFMAELALYGKFVIIDEPLFFRRMHPEAYSWDRTDQQRHYQFWAAGKQFVLPHWKRHFATTSAVWRAPIGGLGKLRLWSHLGRRMLGSRAALASDLWHFAHDRIAPPHGSRGS